MPTIDQLAEYLYVHDWLDHGWAKGPPVPWTKIHQDEKLKYRKWAGWSLERIKQPVARAA